MGTCFRGAIGRIRCEPNNVSELIKGEGVPLPVSLMSELVLGTEGRKGDGGFLKTG